MNKEVNKGFNDQINKEYHSAYIYLGMSEWLNQNGWEGAANWMVQQYREEIAHAEGLMQWVQRVDGKVEFPAIDKATTKYDSILDVFEKALAHEQFITDHINKLVKLSEENDDIASKIFLDWYVMEQVEEEDVARTNVDLFKQADGHAPALMAIDRGMANRTFEPPVIPYLD